MIAGFTEEAFRAELQKYFTPAQPISNPDHLYGRDAKLKIISRALNSPGKHVFIYGDRGIGKTSLAKSAYQVHVPGADGAPIVACDNHSRFFDLVDTIYRQIILSGKTGRNSTNLLAEDSGHITGLALPSMRTINDAVEVLKSAVNREGSPTIIIVDEFDQLSEDEDKKYFADPIKQLSDQAVNLRLILCGIGRSLDELIGVHLSTDRYLATVQLDQIPHDARWKIIEAACERFSLPIDRDSMIRIGQISDGFPYYVHLVGEKIFWEAFDDKEIATKISLDHYQRGINLAIEESQTSLRQAYDLATQKHGNSEDYEEVLWSVADGQILSRQVTDIYEKSYSAVMDSKPKRKPLSKEVFYQRMNMLKRDTHGRIIVGNRQGWYGFRENVVRGYVRLRAERAGVKIGIDHIREGN